MKWTVQKTDEQPFVKVVIEGDFNLTDHWKMIEDIVSRDFWKPGMYAFFDDRNLTLNSAGFATIQAAARNHEENDKRIGEGKSAILMGSMADFVKARQFELLLDEKAKARIRIFLKEEEAIKWLVS
ncbi:MAG TPA: hypothetical protein VF596_19565 [Pyrinomonadaceae bacterium]|jgi:hypothetical protein